MWTARAHLRQGLRGLPCLIAALLFSITSGTAGGANQADVLGTSSSLAALLGRAEKLGVGGASGASVGSREGGQSGALRDLLRSSSESKSAMVRWR